MAYLDKFNNLEIYLLVYTISINITSFLIYGLDKIKAMRKTWRIPELYLTILAFLGGGVGALIGMVTFKHKLSKKRFTIGIPVIIILNFIVTIYIINKIK